MRHDLVDPVGYRQPVPALLALRKRLVHQVLDELVALVRYYGLGVVLKLLLAVADVLFHVLHLADANAEVLDDVAVALEYLDGVPAYRPGGDLALYRLLDVRDGVLDGAGEYVRHLARLLRLRRLLGELDSLVRRLEPAVAL